MGGEERVDGCGIIVDLRWELVGMNRVWSAESWNENKIALWRFWKGSRDVVVMDVGCGQGSSLS